VRSSSEVVVCRIVDGDGATERIAAGTEERGAHPA
jgi:hypothetical protein